mgnify:CR=1 FL=1
MSNQILWDCHMHSSFSADSDTSMEDMIREAICRGLTGICFTEHLDPDYPPTPDNEIFELDLDGYRKTLFRLREKYQKELQIHFGIELGLQPHLHDYFHELLATMPFDFVIGSSHVVHGYDPYYKEYFKGREESACYREYFESILENIAVFDGFDVYGHIDYVVRYGPNKNASYSYQKYADIIDEILKALIIKGKGIEINTGGFKYGLGHPNPAEDIIKRYHELGGEIITIGADAHQPEHVAFDFEKVPSILKEAGFTHYTVFKNRKPEFIPIP